VPPNNSLGSRPRLQPSAPSGAFGMQANAGNTSHSGNSGATHHSRASKTRWRIVLFRWLRAWAIELRYERAVLDACLEPHMPPLAGLLGCLRYRFLGLTPKATTFRPFRGFRNAIAGSPVGAVWCHPRFVTGWCRRVVPSTFCLFRRRLVPPTFCHRLVSPGGAIHVLFVQVPLACILASRESGGAIGGARWSVVLAKRIHELVGWAHCGHGFSICNTR
jgi:hypothetical protein